MSNRTMHDAVVVLTCLSLAACGKKSATGPGTDYNPRIDPADFVAGVTNPFFPLPPGQVSVFQDKPGTGAERVEVTVTRQTRNVMGVTCVVVHDRVTDGANLIEDTFDYYAQDRTGNVWYFGEDTKEYEGGVVVSTAGSWEGGVDGAKPGLIMKAAPAVGDAYRQEYLAGEAEDEAQVLALAEAAQVPFGSFTGCVKTLETTALEPSVAEHKFYARGVGLIITQSARGGGARNELVSQQVVAP